MPPSLCKKSLSRRSVRCDGLADLALRVGIDLLAAGGAPRLAFRLERFPDHRGARIAAGPGAEGAMARAPVDRDHADALRRSEGEDRHAFERLARELAEDRRGDGAALGVAAKAARLIEADIDAGDDVGRAADEPDVGRAGRGAGLAEQGPAEIAQYGGGAALDDSFEHVDDLIGGHRIDDLAGPQGRARHRPAVPVGPVAAVAGPGVGAPDDPAAAVLDIIDQGRGQRPALIGEHREGVGDLEHRRVAGAQ